MSPRNATVSRIDAALDAALEAKQIVGRPSERRYRGSLLGTCIRQQVYAANIVPKSDPPDVRTLRVFERGHLTGAFVNEHLARSRKVRLYVPEVRATLEEYDFAVNIDGYVMWDDGYEEVLEFKSTKTSAFHYVKDKGKPEHFIQAAAGRMALERELGRELGASLVYFAADDWQTRTYEVGREWDARALRVLRALRHFEGRMPPRMRFKKGVDPVRAFPCSYCPWLTKCRGDDYLEARLRESLADLEVA